MKYAYILVMVLLAGCSGNPIEVGILDQDNPNYPPAPSSRAQPPTACYGQYEHNPACAKGFFSYKELVENPYLALTPASLGRISWYMEYAGRNSVSQWQGGGLVYNLYLPGDKPNMEKGDVCRDARLKVQPLKETNQWVRIDTPFCYSYNDALWLPKN